MALQTATQIESDIKVTGGETVTNGGETTYGHFDRVPVEAGEGQGGYGGGVLTTEPSVVIADGRLSNFGPRKGIGATVVVDGTSWLVSNIVPADEDGGTIRLMLQES